MRVEIIGNPVTEYHVSPDTHGRRWTLYQPYTFKIDDDTITAPAGFWTDYASIPRHIWPIIDPYELGRGPILHDFLYFCGYENRRFCDEVFLAAMEIDKISKFKRNSAYLAVRMLGFAAWNKYRNKNKKHMLVRSMPYSMTLSNWQEERQ